jgi:pimeloyl-ACP methyl ester carboxylesterase
VAETYSAGVRIEYDDHGTGEPALLCLTGWCSSRDRWAKVAKIEARHRRVLNVDWRGHGGSDPVSMDFGVTEMVEDALAVIGASGVETVIPCAASHSGWVAIELRRRLGERVPRLVHADWMLSVPSDRYMAVIDQLDSEHWAVARDTLFRIWAAGQDVPWLRDALAVMNKHDEEMWRLGGRVIGSSYAANDCPLDTFCRFNPPVPVLHIYGQPQDPDYFALQERFAADHSWFTVCKLASRTHFAMLEDPENVAAAIEAFV